MPALIFIRAKRTLLLTKGESISAHDRNEIAIFKKQSYKTCVFSNSIAIDHCGVQVYHVRLAGWGGFTRYWGEPSLSAFQPSNTLDEHIVSKDMSTLDDMKRVRVVKCRGRS